jgi:hypothetical protein
MASISHRTLSALIKAADLLELGTFYQWGHMGSCNCGHLAQAVTHLSKEEIHKIAMQGSGDWTNQINDYCQNTGLPLDLIISELTQSGFSVEDLINLEQLRDAEILNEIPFEIRKDLRHNKKSDVIIYLRAWSDLISKKLYYQQIARFSSEVEVN